MATVLNSHQQSQQLVDKVAKYFGNVSHTRYWLVVTSYEPFDGYNVFFNVSRPKMFTRSIPVGEYHHCSFQRLVAILAEFQQNYHFTIIFRGFSKAQLHQLYEHHLIGKS